MKKHINAVIGMVALAVIMFSQSSVTRAQQSPDIVVLSPIGGEVWTKGETNTLKWAVSALPSTGYISLMLNHANGYTVGIIKTIFFSPSQPLSVSSCVWDTRTLTSARSDSNGIPYAVEDFQSGSYQIIAVVVDYTVSPPSVAASRDSATFAIAEDLRLTISHFMGPDSGLAIVTWPKETGVQYRLLSSTNLQVWEQWGIFEDWENWRVVPMWHYNARFFRVQKLSPSLTVSKYSGFGDQTVVAGINDVRLGSFVVSAGSAEGEMVSSITVNLDTYEYSSSTVTRMYLRDHSTGAMLGDVKSSLSSANNYAVNFILPASGNKVIDLYGNIKSGANPGTWQASVSAQASGVTTGRAVSALAQDLQTITIVDHGILTAANGAMPDAGVLIAGSTGNKIAEYTFSAANEGFTIDRLKFKVPFYFALSTASVTVKYRDRNGAARQAMGIFTCGSETQPCVATFTGLTMYVPADDDADLDVYVYMMPFSWGGFSGASGAITLLANEGFRAIGDSGTAVTLAGPADLTGNTFYVRKSKPTFAKQTLTGAPSTGSPLFRFSVVADNAGDIEIKQLSFLVSAIGCNVSGLYLYDSNAGIQLTDIPVDPTNGIVKLPVGTIGDNYVLTIGTTPEVYEVRGVVVNYTASASDSLTVGFAQDTSPTTDGSVSEVAGSGAYNIWSDRSAFSHTVFTTDWCNGYLLKGMTEVQQLP